MTITSPRDTYAEGVATSRRRWVWAGWAAIVLLVLGMFWVGVRAAQAQHALSHAGQHLQRLQRDLLNGDTIGANAEVVAINKDTSRARAKSGGWIFGLAADVPYLGRSPRSVRSLSRAADDLANRPLRSMLDVQSVLSPTTLRGSDGTIDLTALAGSAPRLQAIAQQLHAVRDRVQQSSHGAFVLDPMDRGRAQTLRLLDHVTDQVTVASRFAAVGPGMLGTTTSRHYLVVVQNNNQARGTGGVADAYATVDVRLGKARVTKVAPIATLNNARSWTTANVSPDFPTAAARWRTLFLQAKHGAHVDGVI